MDKISIKDLKESIISASNNLSNNKIMVNDLNVYPVPDGDTGTNMNMTIKSALENALTKNSDTIKGFLEDFSRGSLLGARGNSGVILSQLIRGFVEPIPEEIENLDIALLTKCFTRASEVAYNAVMKPTEGTILTVSKDIAKASQKYPKSDKDILKFLEYIINHGKTSLDNTPNLLSVLKESGVVDAGGMGLICLLEGAFASISGNEIEIKDQNDIVQIKPIKSSKIIDNKVEHGYCTEFLIRTGSDLSPANVESDLKAKLSKIGDSMLVIASEDIIKVHIHTLNPGKALEYAVEYGGLDKIKIDNMSIQHEEIMFEKEMYELNRGKEKTETAIIAVSVGDGFNEIFESLNVSKIIKGGQTMNPSTEDILSAVEETNAEDIYILPNNSNIILSAQQVIGMTEKKVHVIPTRSIPEGINAVLNFNESLEPEEIINNINKSLEELKVGEVTFSVRGTKFNGQEIQEGEILGLYNKNIVSKGSSVNQITEELIHEMIDDGNYLISIYYGEEISQEEANDLLEKLSKKYDEVDVEIIYGGQPLYYYIVSIE